MEKTKLVVDIINSIVNTLVLLFGALIGGMWAYCKFGHEEKIIELRNIKSSLINFRENANLYSFYNHLASTNVMFSENLKTQQFNLETSRSLLKSAFDQSFYIDMVKKILWQGSLSKWMLEPISELLNEESRRTLSKEITKIEVGIEIEAQKHNMFIRRIRNFFRK